MTAAQNAASVTAPPRLPAARGELVYLCARPGCDRVIALGVFACVDDWRGLPVEIRGAIIRAWAVRRRHPESHGAAQLHERAKARAIEWWGEQ